MPLTCEWISFHVTNSIKRVKYFQTSPIVQFSNLICQSTLQKRQNNFQVSRPLRNGLAYDEDFLYACDNTL